MKKLINPAISAEHQKKKKGFTLTEIAIVLGIVGLILGAIWTAAAAVYNNQRISHANTAILQVTQGIRTLMSTSSSVGTAGDMTSVMVSAGIIPSDLVNGIAAIGPWDGSTLKVLTKAATDTAVTIELNNVPKSACAGLLTQLGGASRDPGLTSVGSTTASAPVVQAQAGTALNLLTTQIAPISAAVATAACSGVTNPVQFQFSLK